MKVIFRKSDLSHGLEIVGHATSNRSLPILANVKLTTEQNRVLLEATNLELGVQCWVEAVVEEAGCITLPARLLTDFVSILPHEQITIAVPEGTYQSTITSELSEATIPTMDPTEFPTWPQLRAGGFSLVMEAQTFKELVGGVAFAASTDEKRPALTGICVQVGRDKITCAAADAFRLAVRSYPLADGSAEPTELVVPAKTLKEIATILPGQGQVTIRATTNQILLFTDTVNLASRLLEARYPNFWQMIPEEYHTRAVMQTRLFLPIIKAAALFAQDSTHTATLDLKPQGGTLTISAQAEGIGANTSTIAAAYSHPIEDLTMQFNVRYIADVLAVIGNAAEIAFEVCTRAKPGILRPVGTQEAIFLIMPMQIKPTRPARPAVEQGSPV